MSNQNSVPYAEGLGGIIASGMWAAGESEKSIASTALSIPSFSNPSPVTLLRQHVSESDRTRYPGGITELCHSSIYSSNFENKVLHSTVEVKSDSSGVVPTNKGDWTCTSCGNTNYSWRHVCNMRKCRAPKPGYLNSEPSPPGSWACLNCGNLNYAERTFCNMRKCRSPRPGYEQINKEGYANESFRKISGNDPSGAIFWQDPGVPYIAGKSSKHIRTR